MAEVEKTVETKETKKAKKEPELVSHTPYYIPGEPRTFEVYLNSKKYVITRGKENLVPKGVKEILVNMEQCQEYAAEYVNAYAIKE